MTIFRSSRRARRGNAALVATLMLMPMSLLAGVGIDFGRAYVAQTRLSGAVDAAALAGGRKLSVADPASDARMYFDANFKAAQDGIVISDFSARPIDGNNLLLVKARGTMKTTFLSLAGQKWATLPISAQATARRTTLGMEMALVLDVTGSMRGASMTQLRTAATSLISILFGDKSSIETLYVSVVPFVTSANFGTNRTTWISGGVKTNDYLPHLWRGCTEARTAPEDESDTPPVTGPNFSGTPKPFTTYLYKTTNGSTRNPPLTDNDWNKTNKLPTDTNNPAPATAWTLSDDKTGPNLGCGQPIAGLDNNQARIKNVIAKLEASSRSGTIIPVGLQAGWMSLSPKWRGLWGTNAWGSTTPNGFPLDYNTPYMQKVILLITDGTNNWFQKTSPTSPEPDYTSYGRLSEKRLGASITTVTQAKTELNTRTLRMCNKIKSNNIIIYAITTGSGVDASTKTLFTSCATSAAYYYDAPNASQLNAIFVQIGSQLSNLRLER